MKDDQIAGLPDDNTDACSKRLPQMPWFRMWRSDLHDRALQSLPAETFRAAINLRCSADHVTGHLPQLVDLEYALRLTPAKLKRHIEILISSGFLRQESGALMISDWRQVASDNEAASKRNQRLRRKMSEDNDRTSPAPCPEPVPTQRETIIKNKIQRNNIVPFGREREEVGTRTSLPHDHQPTQKDRSAAAEYGLDDEAFEIEFEKFVNHHVAKGSAKSDWHAAWRYWLAHWSAGTFAGRFG